jgi:hypothetical protein
VDTAAGAERSSAVLKAQQPARIRRESILPRVQWDVNSGNAGLANRPHD